MIIEKSVPAKIKCDFCGIEFFWDKDKNFCYMIMLGHGYNGYEEIIHICDKNCEGMKNINHFLSCIRERWHKEDISDIKAKKLYWSILKEIKS